MNRNYFRQNPKHILKSIIRLLEHVVIVFDLYQDEKKLSDMCDFFHSIIRPTYGMLGSQNLVNILDQWRLKLFRLHINNKMSEV